MRPVTLTQEPIFKIRTESGAPNAAGGRAGRAWRREQFLRWALGLIAAVFACTGGGSTAATGPDPGQTGLPPGGSGPPTSNPNLIADTTALACPKDADDPLAAARRQCVARINALRASLNLKALSRWCTATACVDGQTAADRASNTAHSAFQKCGEHGQNECIDFADRPLEHIDVCLEQMWSEGPGSDFSSHGHYLNMTSSAFTTVECGFHDDGNTFWSAQDFN